MVEAYPTREMVRSAISHAVVPGEDPGVVADGVSRMPASFRDEIPGSSPA